jgi:DNA repair exonuclease SbcCD ATPase subunit
MGLLEKLRQRLAEARERRERERKAAELTAEKLEALRSAVPELRYFEKPSHADLADALTLRLARKGVYLTDKEARRLALEVARDPSALDRFLMRVEAERLRQRAERVREKARRVREREAERRRREVERRIAAADAFLSGMLGFDPFSPPKRSRSRRRR